MTINLLPASELTLSSLIIRLIFAAFVGGAIGLERETKSRPAGFRTYMLVAIGATIAMLLNQYLDYMQTKVWAEFIPFTGRTDASRLGAQVINGIGFLGAGTILVTKRQEIKGLTTSAGLWTSACVGLSIGAGFYECAIVGMLLILICMRSFSGLENMIMSSARNMNVYMELNSYENLGSVSACIRSMGIKVFNVDVDKGSKGDKYISATFDIYLPAREAHETVLVRLSAIQGVNTIKEM